MKTIAFIKMVFWKMHKKFLFFYFVIFLNILKNMKVFEDDQLMAYKPRKEALLSHRDVYIPVQPFTKRGAGVKGLAKSTICIFEVYGIIIHIEC